MAGHWLLNLLLYQPGHSGFSRYAERILPFLVGHQLWLQDEKSELNLTREGGFPVCLPQSRRLRLLSRLSMAQHGISLSRLLGGAGLADFDGVYSPFCDYLFECKCLPQLITCHDLTPFYFFGSCRSYLRYRYWTPVHLWRADRVVAISSYVADQLCGIGFPAKRILVIPNGISCEREPVVEPASQDWLVIARHDRNKNLFQVIRAFSVFLEYCPDWLGKLCIVGHPGRETARILRLVKELRLSSKISLVSSLSDLDLVAQIRRSFALISASLMEGFDYPVLEAKSEGIPTLVSNIPVHCEFHTGSSLMFDSGKDVQGLVSAMLELASDSQLWKQLSLEGFSCAKSLSIGRQVSGIRQAMDEMLS